MCFKKCETFNPEIRDHNLIYVIMEELVNQYKPRTKRQKEIKQVKCAGEMNDALTQSI